MNLSSLRRDQGLATNSGAELWRPTMRNLLKTTVLAASATIVLASLSSQAPAAELIINNQTGHVVNFVRSDRLNWTGAVYPGQRVEISVFRFENSCTHRLSAASNDDATWGPTTINQCSNMGPYRRYTWTLVDPY
jgi:hypothetical protein